MSDSQEALEAFLAKSDPKLREAFSRLEKLMEDHGSVVAIEVAFEQIVHIAVRKQLEKGKLGELLHAGFDAIKTAVALDLAVINHRANREDVNAKVEVALLIPLAQRAVKKFQAIAMDYLDLKSPLETEK
jgi:hypothetical protein